MIRTAAFLLVGSVAFSQDHQASVNEHGDHVMGFSHEKTTQHFELNYEGGLIDVRANDSHGYSEPQSNPKSFPPHRQDVCARNFNAPMLVHSTEVPGTATMTRLKDHFHWQLQKTSRGARIKITADNKPALDAVNEFLRFQIEDHKTGDCTAVR